MAGISLASQVGVGYQAALGRYQPQAVIVLYRFCRVLNSSGVGGLAVSASSTVGCIQTLPTDLFSFVVYDSPKKLGKPLEPAKPLQLSDWTAGPFFFFIALPKPGKLRVIFFPSLCLIFPDSSKDPSSTLCSLNSAAATSCVKRCENNLLLILISNRSSFCWIWKRQPSMMKECSQRTRLRAEWSTWWKTLPFILNFDLPETTESSRTKLQQRGPMETAQKQRFFENLRCLPTSTTSQDRARSLLSDIQIEE